ncbi:MAG TPA: PQQ-binding-like beta-propeller repeat protein [Pirellulales bacterium]|nr:PQQ-binding-like beta-propeller repeat protein [Pirellulales bacterium]
MTTQSIASADPAARPNPLRVWPAVLLLVLLVVARVSPYLAQEMSFGLFMFAVNTPLVAGLGILLWWMFGSRATGRERWFGPLAVVAIGALCYFLLDPSLKGMGFFFYIVPTGMAALSLTLICLGRLRSDVRLWGALAAALVGFMGWDLVRSEGIWGDFKTTLAWRWKPTAEELFLASLDKEGASAAPTAEGAVSSEDAATPTWSEFRGPQRDSVVHGAAIDTDWKNHPPKELWRRKVGPSWSSFAVAGHSIFTQEQRGDAEAVVCYDADTGNERWIHTSPARFWESVAGAGPRATPTLKDGKLFAVGATGLVHCLNPANGAVIWERDLTKDAAREPLTWGFSSSPLVVGDVVVVYAGGADDKGVFAYDIASGEPRWSVPAGDHSYSSPHRANIAGRDVVLMLTNTGLTAIDPVDGKKAWDYEWKYEGYRTLQPLVVDGSGILLGTGMGTGTRRVDVSLASGTPEISDRWTSLEMKPDFNDYVAHKGFLYGFDHNFFSCVDLETGKRTWKKRGYGNGQVLLLPDADQLLVLSESGDVAVLSADSKNSQELARTKVLDNKTWNHPVLVGDRLYVRNGEEAVCLQLPLLATATSTTAIDSP